ncbi:hypothetical protein, partial [Salmonella enterica]|uniref:hypothetical protein n=1 Tax=Salmonella enterica TaxID=28901 RepID=UPI0024AA124A
KRRYTAPACGFRVENDFSFSGGTKHIARPRQRWGFGSSSPTEMCETDFEDFSFCAIAGCG